MTKSEILRELPKCDKAHKISKYCWKNGTDGLVQCRVATSLQFLKNPISEKQNKLKHNKTRYVCNLYLFKQHSSKDYSKITFKRGQDTEKLMSFGVGCWGPSVGLGFNSLIAGACEGLGRNRTARMTGPQAFLETRGYSYTTEIFCYFNNQND